MVEERVLAFLHADRIDDRLARNAFQPGLDHAPLRAVDHDRHAGDVGLGGDQLEEGGHRRLGVEQALVHVDVDDLRAVLDLLARDLDGARIVAGHDQLLERGRAGDVGALADVDEHGALRLRHVAIGSAAERSEASRSASRQLRLWRPPPRGRGLVRRRAIIGSMPARRVRRAASEWRAADSPATAFAIAAICVGRGAAAAADDVDDARARPFARPARRCRRRPRHIRRDRWAGRHWDRP